MSRGLRPPVFLRSAVDRVSGCSSPSAAGGSDSVGDAVANDEPLTSGECDMAVAENVESKSARGHCAAVNVSHIFEFISNFYIPLPTLVCPELLDDGRACMTLTPRLGDGALFASN